MALFLALGILHDDLTKPSVKRLAALKYAPTFCAFGVHAMRSLFWANFCLAVFFGFFEIVMLAVIVLYSAVLGEVRTSQQELNGIYAVTLFMAGFVACTGLTAWALRPKRQGPAPIWTWLTEVGAVVMALFATLYISSLA